MFTVVGPRRAGDSQLAGGTVAWSRRSLVYVGIHGCCVALDRDTGDEVWRATLGTDYMTVYWDGEALFVATRGEVTRLDPETGAALWHNKLKGLGRGLVSLASNRAPSAPMSADEAAEQKRRETEVETAAAAAG